MKKATWNWEFIVGLTGIALALLSLWFTFKQTSLSEAHNRVSVQPKLTLAFQVDSKRERFGWYLSNNGLGPAYFTGFQLFVDDIPVQSRTLGGWLELLNKLGLRKECFSTAWTPNKTSLSNGSSIDEPLIRLNKTKDATCENDFGKLMLSSKRIKAKIDYHSIYGDKFSITESPYQLDDM
jgi:hypothetical protein